MKNRPHRPWILDSFKDLSFNDLSLRTGWFMLSPLGGGYLSWWDWLKLTEATPGHRHWLDTDKAMDCLL